ncbi:hypothetical protein BBJ28_00021902 [Nothophytophthora sp. Chile5]|nr:hypothetical protein BBJ28_00021902 [Nothophytophthora sp. Chile5]
MSHKRSVLLTQIWAYRCQNGRMQVMYLAQITYHLVYNSDLYLIGLATGTLTLESIANLACCFFAFSYSFVNLLKARSGDQQLDRHFRLIWETLQIPITAVVVLLLCWVQVTPVDSLLSQNGEILRKTTSRGLKYCGLNDSCIVFTINALAFILVFSTGLGLAALIISMIATKMAPSTKRAIRTVRLSLLMHPKSYVVQSASGPPASTNEKKAKPPPHHDSEKTLLELTTFEQNCLGAPFRKLFRDCDDMAYANYKGKRCTTVEALLLTGYLFYGQHVYQASAVMLLLAARLVPRKVLRTFNMLLLRWRVDPEEGTLSHALSCTWYTASAENHKFAAATPVA